MPSRVAGVYARSLWGGTWDAAAVLVTGATSPVVSYDEPKADLFAAWVSGGAMQVKRHDGTGWDAAATTFASSAAATFPVCHAASGGGVIPCFWTRASDVGPFEVRSAVLRP